MRQGAIVSALEGQKQKDHGFKARWGYLVRLCLDGTKGKNKKMWWLKKLI